MRRPRVVRRVNQDGALGKTFIETAPERWAERLAARDADHSQPSPMPWGHMMFRRPTDYRCVPIDHDGATRL